ncbi:MAG: PhoH family protein, partial [Ilumatobacteraceae bacterium]
LTRIGFGSKVVVTGDMTQVDIPDNSSGLFGLEKILHYFIRERRRATTFVCLLLVSVGYAYIVVQQVRYSTPAGFGWPGVYSKVHGVVLLATVYFTVRCALDSSDESDSLSPS